MRHNGDHLLIPALIIIEHKLNKIILKHNNITKETWPYYKIFTIKTQVLMMISSGVFNNLKCYSNN